MVTNEYGLASVPLWNELLGVAVNDRDWHTRELCQMLVQRYLRGNVGTEDLLYKILEESEKEQPKQVNGFFISCALIAVKNNHMGEAAELLASIIHKDENPPDVRDAIFLSLKVAMGSGPHLLNFWKDVRKALVSRETKREVSKLANLQGMMEPQGKLKGKIRPGKREPAEIARAKKVARS